MGLAKPGFLLLLCAAAGCAQQAIVNMPSADITPKGKHFLMHETQWRPWQPRYWYGTNFYCYGVGASTELTVTNWNAGGSAPNFATGIGFKSAPQLLKETHPHAELKVTFGQKLVLNHRGKGLGSFSYGHLSFRTPKTHTRITAGGFHGTRQLLTRTTGNFLAGLEQPLNKSDSLIWVNEYMHGRHDFGNYVTGLLYHPGGNKNHVIVAAVKIPTHADNGKLGLVLEYGLFF